MDEAVAIVARSLWSVQVPKILRSRAVPLSLFGRQMSGGFNAAPQSATDEEKDYQDVICLGRKGGRFSQRRTAQSLSLQGLLLGSFA